MGHFGDNILFKFVDKKIKSYEKVIGGEINGAYYWSIR